jgi:hypothetical protein
MNIQDMVDRSKWLDSLKVGDQVAANTRQLPGFQRNFGYKIFRITKITPKRTRFEVIGPDSETHVFGRDGSFSTGSTYNMAIHRMAPVTAEVMASIQADTLNIRADNRRYRLVNKLEELRSTLKDKPDLHLEFLGASEQLMALLDKHTKPDPEDA